MCLCACECVCSQSIPSGSDELSKAVRVQRYVWGSTPPSRLKPCVLTLLFPFFQWLHLSFVSPPLVSLNGMVLFLQSQTICRLTSAVQVFLETDCLSDPQYGSSWIVLYRLRFYWKTSVVEAGSVQDKHSFMMELDFVIL